MNKPTILHLLPGISLTGGTAAKVLSLIKQSQYTHIVLVPIAESGEKKYKTQWQQINNCILIEGLNRKNYIKSILKIKAIIKQYNVNIIHTYFPPETIIASLVKRCIPNIKIIRSFEGNVKQSIIKRKVISFSLKNFDCLIYISQYIKECYQNRIPKILHSKGEIIYNAAARRSSTLKPIKHNAQNRELVTVSGLNPSKNLFILIDAINILIKRKEYVHLNILGDGNLRHELQTKINTLNLQKYVTLLGYSDQVIEYLDNSSIYVHPANNEGFGIAVVEAMQRYCAVIVSDAGALPEIISNNIDGIIASSSDSLDWANKITMLLSNQNLIDKLGENAYFTANSKFSINAYIQKHERLYSKLINN